MRFRHKKRDTVYNLFEIFQTNEIVREGDKLVIPLEYGHAIAEVQCSSRCATGWFVAYTNFGSLWARPLNEFFDGRFERV